MGGGYAEDIDEEDEPEEIDSLQVKPLHTFNLAQIKRVLRRDDAIARTALPGKHREMVMQMKTLPRSLDPN